MRQPICFKPTEYRVGIGYDVHCLKSGRKLVLGGVEIPFKKGLNGHSDSDVLLHAIADAVLGAAGKGDIGEHFPDTDSKFKGISSLLLLEKVRKEIESVGLKVVNVDCVLLAEEPKIKVYKPAMRKKIAKALNIEKTQVNIKATTCEGLGAIGRGEGMSAYATVLLCSADY